MRAGPPKVALIAEVTPGVYGWSSFGAPAR